MQKNIVLLCLITLLFLSCKKDKDIEVPAPMPMPLEKAIIGKWIETGFPPSSAIEYHFLDDSVLLHKNNGFQPVFVCNAKYTINKNIYTQTLGYFQIVGTPGQCNTSQNFNLKMLEINDSTFTASQSFYTGNPPHYFIDVVTKYRKF